MGRQTLHFLRWGAVFLCVVCESVVYFPILSLFLLTLFQAEEQPSHALLLAALLGIWIGVFVHLSPAYTLSVVVLMQCFVRWPTKEMSFHSRVSIAVFFGMCALLLSRGADTSLALVTQHLLVYIPLSLFFRTLARRSHYAYSA